MAGSVCGVTLNGDYAMPLTGSAGDKAAAERSLQYQMAIFADPIFRGTWPEAVVAGAGAALPPLDSKVKGTHMGTYFQVGPCQGAPMSRLRHRITPQTLGLPSPVIITSAITPCMRTHTHTPLNQLNG